MMLMLMKMLNLEPTHLELYKINMTL